MDIRTASDLLSKLSLRFILENYEVNVKRINVYDAPFTQKINRHKHSTFEYHILSSGSCRVTTDLRTFDVQAGDYYLTGPGVYHEQTALSSGGYVEYALDCEITLVEEAFTESSELVHILTTTECKPIRDRKQMLKLYEQALAEAYHRKVGYVNTLRNLIGTMLITSARAMAWPEDNGRQAVEPLVLGNNDFRMVQLERFIQDNLGVRLTTSDLASYIGLSDKQVCRIIREKTGKNTKEFILELKMEAAKELLHSSLIPVKQIGEQIGFESEVYFNQWFKQRTGISPGGYRKSTF